MDNNKKYKKIYIHHTWSCRGCNGQRRTITVTVLTHDYICSELDKLVMNFLLVEGYKEAAESFARESSLTTAASSSSVLSTATIATRTALRHLLLAGDCRAAISLLNDHHPDLLDSDPLLAARLHVQLLVEAVRSVAQSKEVARVAEVIKVAREQVGPIVATAVIKAGSKQAAAEAEALMRDFDRSLAILLVPPGVISGAASGGDSMVCKQAAAVMDTARRSTVAAQVNRAVLEAAGQECESILPKLLSLSHVRLDSTSNNTSNKDM